MMNCLLMHNNWLLDQLRTLQRLQYLQHALFGRWPLDERWVGWGSLHSLTQPHTAPFKESFQLRRRAGGGKEEPRVYILPWFIIIKLIINKTLERQWPWKKSKGSLECAWDLLADCPRGVSRWGAADAPSPSSTPTKSPRATGGYSCPRPGPLGEMEVCNSRGVGFGVARFPSLFGGRRDCTLQRVLVSTAGTVKMLMQQFNKYLMALSLACWRDQAGASLLKPTFTSSFIYELYSFPLSHRAQFRQTKARNTVERGTNNSIPDHQSSVQVISWLEALSLAPDLTDKTERDKRPPQEHGSTIFRVMGIFRGRWTKRRGPSPFLTSSLARATYYCRSCNIFDQ